MPGRKSSSSNSTLLPASERDRTHFVYYSCFVNSRWYGQRSNSFYKRLASCLATKWDQPYSPTMSWLWCRVAFSLLRSAKIGWVHQTAKYAQLNKSVRLEWAQKMIQKSELFDNVIFTDESTFQVEYHARKAYR